MRVGIDVTALIYGRGVSRYTGNLVRALAVERADIDLRLYGTTRSEQQKLRSEIMALRTDGGRKFKFNLQKLPVKMVDYLWRWGLNPVQKTTGELDLFHSWDWLQPPDKDLPLVSTIHDLAILKYPEVAKPEVVKAHQRSWQILRERGAQIITVSEATRNDVINLLGFPPYQVEVIYEALPVENILVAQEMTEEKFKDEEQSLGLDENQGKPFILFVGTREPRKNLARLIEAWAPLANYIDLVIAGEVGGDVTENYEGQFGAALRFLGRVSDQQLAVLYTEAEIFAFPSLDEGFGLPILESFYYGTPVLTSNLSAMKEVAGDAALLVDPFEVGSIYNGLVSLLNEDETAQQRRSQKMILRQRMFSWEKAARETAAVYEKVFQQKTG